MGHVSILQKATHLKKTQQAPIFRSFSARISLIGSQFPSATENDIGDREAIVHYFF